MADLLKDIAAYESMQTELEVRYFGKWVVLYDEEFIGAYDTFEAAAENAVERFGRGPYLIRRVGASPPTLPASVLYRPVHADR